MITGKVRDEVFLLQGASVSIYPTRTITDSNGEFTLSLNPGEYLITITHTGYKKLEQRINVTSKSYSFQFNMLRDERLGEMVILGSRSTVQRSHLTTASPVDVIDSKALRATAQYSFIQMMNFSAPSFNVSRQNLYEPVTLRGLAPDHLLILLNGTRYHTTAYVNNNAIKGTLGLGSVANDLNSIPFAAIEKIEILRDGSSAQYVSDAIAGVLNIDLKKGTNKTFIHLQLGQQYKGDGEYSVLGINHGIKLNNKKSSPKKQGYLNLSGDLRYRKPTHRGGEYEGTVYFNIPSNASEAEINRLTTLDNNKIAERNFNRKTPVSNDGSIKLSSLGFLINGGFPVSNQVEFFWTGLINYRWAVNQGAYRFPKTISQVNTALYPDGFKINAVVNSRDISAIAGLKGKTNNGWNWELNSVYGENANDQIGRNTNNASQYFLGVNAPTQFYGGAVSFAQQTNYINFVKHLIKQPGGLKSFTLGFGAEYRIEKYRTLAGDEGSWKNYDSSGFRMGGAQGTGGINPLDIINKSRYIKGLYVDLETDLNDHLLINVSNRYEQSQDYGNNFSGKIAMRYKFLSGFLLRGSVGNSYHAPALQQISLRATLPAWRNGVAVTTGIFPNNSNIVKAFGVKKLQPEKAINFNGGFTSTFLPYVSVTVDAYWIQIKNRIVLSGVFDTTNSDVLIILKDYPQIDQVQFITNAINTTTQGLDIVINGNRKIKKANLGFVAAANFTRTNLFGAIQTTDKLPGASNNTNTMFNREEREKIEHGQPASKIIFLANYTNNKFGIVIRNTRFGKTSIVLSSKDSSRDEAFSAKLLTDLSITYQLKRWLILTAGANNIFNIYPDRIKNPLNKNQGILIYSNEGTPFGYNGGSYNLSVSLDL